MTDARPNAVAGMPPRPRTALEAPIRDRQPLGRVALRDVARYCRALAEELERLAATDPEARLGEAGVCALRVARREGRPFGSLADAVAAEDRRLRGVPGPEGAGGRAPAERLRGSSPAQTPALIGAGEHAAILRGRDGPAYRRGGEGRLTRAVGSCGPNGTAGPRGAPARAPSSAPGGWRSVGGPPIVASRPAASCDGDAPRGPGGRTWSDRSPAGPPPSRARPAPARPPTPRPARGPHGAPRAGAPARRSPRWSSLTSPAATSRPRPCRELWSHGCSGGGRPDPCSQGSAPARGGARPPCRRSVTDGGPRAVGGPSSPERRCRSRRCRSRHRAGGASGLHRSPSGTLLSRVG
jgi:hypothetical protein